MRWIKAPAVATICSFVLLFGTASAEQLNPEKNSTADADVSFRADVEPILSRHCYGCHQGAKQLGSYQMTRFAELVAGGESDRAAIVPGKPNESYLIDQITPIDGHAEMPDEPFPPLSEVEIDLITRWITQGAINDSPADGGPRYDSDHPPTYAAAPPLPSIDASPDGSTLAVAGYHEILLIDADTGETKKRLIGISPRINTVRFSPDGKHIAAAAGTPGQRGELQVWNAESGDLSLSVLVTYDTLCGASWSPDAKKIAFGAADNTVRAIDAVTGEQVLFQGAHDDWVRDTAFTADSNHLISVARDMTCKLTEVETQRFVDNITSITPGELSGGLSSVVSHPQRDEIFVGGADGIAKVYRVFRQTQRRIGDDANLVRSMPKLPGRIVSVAISPDATRLAAAATLDGQSEVRVWQYDFDGTISPEQKAILAKRVADRSEEEKKKVEELRASPIQELAKFSIDHAAVYAITLAPDNSLWITATDGKVRRLDPSGALVQEFDAVEIFAAAKTADSGFDAKTWNEMQTRRMEDAAKESASPVATLTELTIEPSQLVFSSPYDYSQLVITAAFQDGTTADVTRVCQIEIPEWLTMTARGFVRPLRDASGKILIRYGQRTETVKVAATGVSGDGEDHGKVDYVRDVGPVLSRLGCNAGTCHGAQKGKNGFRLSLRGYDPLFDLRALTDDLSARRINPAAPDESLMLRKPLGTSPHQGGTLMTAGDANHTVLRRWIADGSKLDLNSPHVTGIDVTPINPIVQSTSSRQQVRVVAHYSDGSHRDVTHDAFIESGNTEVATADKSGLLSAIRRGEAPILARFEGAYAATTLTVMGDRKDYRQPDVQTWSEIDQWVAAKWNRVKVTPSDLCDDATFLRRVHLDLIGLPPTSDQVRAFLADDTPTRVKRSRVIDKLIGSEAYIEFWTNKWADLLQVNRKFLGVEGSTKFRDWIHRSVAENKPYDQFAREVLTATGSNNENPPASYFKVLRNPEDTMENTTHLFLGIRFNCNKCHDHPFERWTQDQYYEMSAFFAQVGLERDPASGKRTVGGTAVEGAKPLFEKVVDKSEGEILHPRTGKPVPPAFPFNVQSKADEKANRRGQLAHWITDKDNPYFSRSYVNRLWGYLLGAGLIEPIDDIRAGNPATNPELLDHLTKTFVDSGFDIRQMHRVICNSRTYQLSITSNSLNEDDLRNYSHALPRRLPAEVIYDTVHAVTGSVSDIPGVPKGTRAAALSDSGVKLPDGFLQNLGRPARESSCECERTSDLQLGPIMALISGPTVGTAISDPKNELERIVQDHTDDRQVAEEIFLRALSRMPSDAELSAFSDMTRTIRQNHKALVSELETSEETWNTRRIELESQRQRKLAEMVQEIAAHTEKIKPERERLEKERTQRIAAAQQLLAETNKKVSKKTAAWATKSESSVEWFPLAASNLAATNKASLIAQADRSIVASGKMDKGTYVVSVKTSLNPITGFRLEALADASLPSGGPGLAENGNFVLTELEVKAAAASEPTKQSNVKIASGVADFLQNGFHIRSAFDGVPRNQKGWAVSGALGVDHWATFKLAKPIENKQGTVLTFHLHQFHNAANHRLGRFRISATTHPGDLPLGHPETLASILATPPADRTDQAKKHLEDYVLATDPEIRKAREQIASANKPVPPDEGLVRRNARKEKLSNPTPDDPKLVQLREDAKQSIRQLNHIRLTAAEDLTWALVNSPAFLFNH